MELVRVVKLLKKFSLKLIIVESCTGGLLSSTITSTSGSSEIFEYGLITYSNNSKINLLNVSRDLLKIEGAVSKKVSIEMIRMLSHKDENINNIFISITGIAGPNGGTNKKPIGTVFVTFSIKKKFYTYRLNLGNIGRIFIQKEVVAFVLRQIYKLVLKNYDKNFSGL